MREKLYCKGGGCTAKLGAGALSKVLSLLEKRPDENLLVGFDSHDDAAVYKVSEDQAVVSTLDFFPPLVEDPYTFGAIAAANALSDVYAMGGTPIMALNIVCFPETMDLNILGKILEGGNAKILEAGAVLAGGHSINDTDVKYGLSVTGLVNPDRLAANNTLQGDEVLYLTKPLGTGVVLCAHRIGRADAKSVDQAVASMLTLNKTASEAAIKAGVHAMSDVTGFGLGVHLLEMLDGKYSAILNLEDIPHFDRVPEYIDEFYITAAGQKNRNFAAGRIVFEDDDYTGQELVFDPQTSGGLLAAFAPQQALVFEQTMKEAGAPFWKIGTVTQKQEAAITVKGTIHHD